MCRDLEADKSDSQMYFRRHNGELIIGPTSLAFNDAEFMTEAKRLGYPPLAAHQVRRKFFRMLLRQVARVGLKVHYGQQVEKYFEDEEAGVAGVVTEDGSVRVAHLVVAADASRTQSELLISGRRMPSRPSGMTVYRTSLPTELAMKNDAFRARFGNTISKGVSSHEFWMAPGMHLGLYISFEFCAFGLTPRDSTVQADSTQPIESWDPNVDPMDVVKVLHHVPDWDPAVEGLILAAPPNSVVHWPLLWRNLNREWTSKGGRVVQVGDAAHTTLPASANGGTLAIEDAVTLASCLQLSSYGGNSNAVPMGTRVYNLLRYQRVSCSQKMAFVNFESLSGGKKEHDKSSEEKSEKGSDKNPLKFPRWLYQHDPEAYVYDKYSSAFAHLSSGTPFQNTNFPRGHKFAPWTIEGILEDIKAGKSIVDFLDGDWS